MSNFSSYKTAAFKETQKFFVLDPATGSPSFVQGSDLVSYITPMLNYVRADSTRLAAENTDYDVGTLVQTSGATSPGDNFAATYLVVEGGSGDFPMLNGNDLLVIKGDEFLRDQLIQNTAGDGSDLVAHTGTSDTVTEALDKRVIRKTSIAEIEALTGAADYQVSLSGLRAGIFEFDESNLSAEVTADAQQGIYIAPSSDDTGASGAWVRQYDGPLKAAWFGADDASSANRTALQAMWDFISAKGYGGAQIEKDYEIESPLNITKANHDKYINVVLSGPGNIKKATSFTGDRLVNIASDYFDEDNIVFFHLSFDGVDKSVNGVDWFDETEPYDSNPTTTANTVYSKAIRFDNCNFNRCYRGARVSGNSNTFSSCTFRANACGTFNTVAANDIRYIGCNFRRGSVGAHIKTSSASLGTVSTQFVGCVFESNQITGLALEDRPSDVGIHGFYFENNGFNLSSTDYPSMTAPAEACHIYSFGNSFGSGFTLVSSGEFWPAPAGVIDIYGSQLSRFTVVSTPFSMKPTNVFNSLNVLSGDSDTVSLSAVDISAFTPSEGEIYATVNGQKFYIAGGAFVPLEQNTYNIISAAATKTVATTTNIRDVFEVWVENGPNNAVKLIAHRGSSSVVEVALMGISTGKPTAVWSGDNLDVTAGTATANRVTIKKMMRV